MIKRIFIILAVVTLFQNSDRAWSDNSQSIIIKNRCANCHNMTGPASASIEAVKKKKAPDLFYAGNKFQKMFLVRFLQNPILLRPAGPIYLNNIDSDGRSDIIKAKIFCSSKLSRDEAISVADFLMTLKKAGMKTGLFKSDNFSLAKAQIIFEKSEACHGCHQYRVKDKISGGVSAPILFNAGSRLNGDWVYSFLKDPQYWEPMARMAKKDISSATIQLLTSYIMSMK